LGTIKATTTAFHSKSGDKNDQQLNSQKLWWFFSQEIKEK